MSEEEKTTDQYSADYVEKLRYENGGWRQKVRDLESELEKYHGLEDQVVRTRVENELIRRGVTDAEPDWVKVQNADDVKSAVDTFLEKYPQFTAHVEGEERQPQRREYPSSLPPEPGKANTPGPPPVGSFGGRTMEEIKEDPLARQQLTEQYRALLGNSTE